MRGINTRLRTIYTGEWRNKDVPVGGAKNLLNLLLKRHLEKERYESLIEKFVGKGYIVEIYFQVIGETGANKLLTFKSNKL